MLIGYWSKSVWLTYLGVVAGVFGLAFSLLGAPSAACICLIIAGVCDLFDGKVARATKRSKAEKAFGVELDSLADTVSFVVLPAVFFLCLQQDLRFAFIPAIFCVCGIARLAFFNTIADSDAPVKFYRGLPVTTIAIIMPLVFTLTKLINPESLAITTGAALAITACLNVLDIKIPKPRGAAYPVLVVLAIALIIALILL